MEQQENIASTSGGSSPAPHPPGPQHPQPEASVDYETVFTNAKAGMDGVDKEKVKRVVYEMSKNSAHFQNEQRKMQQTEEKIKRMKAQAAGLTPSELAAHTAAMNTKIAELEATRDLTRTWIVVDLDAFFASVEELDNPALKDKPFCVGGLGMISTANYVARQYGVRSAMPGFIGRKLCPQLIFVPPRFEKYREASEKTRAIFAAFDKEFESGSLDEAYLDVTEYCALHGVTGEEVAATIRRRMREETGLTCSCGIAPNRMLAKVCSDRNKPDGQFHLPPTLEAVSSFARELEIRKTPGVGRVTEHMLKAFDVKKGGDVLEKKGLVAALFSPIAVEFFLRAALGLGNTRHSEKTVEGEVGRKGISCERTFRSTSSKSELEAKCRDLAVSLAEDMAAEGLKGKTLTLKLKLSTFVLRTRAATLDRYIYTADDIAATCLRLLKAELPAEVRLLGLRMSNFQEAVKREKGQQSLEDIFQRKTGSPKRKHHNDNQEPQHQHQGYQQKDRSIEGANLRDSSEDQQQRVQEEEDGYEDHALQEQGAVEGEPLSLSAGELVELTLRDWQHQQQMGSRGPASVEYHPGYHGHQKRAREDISHDDDMVSLPGSLAVSPATAARYESQPDPANITAAGEGEEGFGSKRRVGLVHIGEKHHQQRLPDTVQAAGTTRTTTTASEAGGGFSFNSTARKSSSHLKTTTTIWSCEACTYENPRGTGWCEMCGTSRSGRRPGPSLGITGQSNGAGKAGVNSGKKGGSSSKGHPSIMAFCKKKEPSQREQQQPIDSKDGIVGDKANRDAAVVDNGESLEHIAGTQEGGLEISRSQQEVIPGNSPLLPGEDVEECDVCGKWVRSSLYDAHQAEHRTG